MRHRTAGKVLLRNTEDGREMERWPVDARDFVRTGQWEIIEGAPQPGLGGTVEGDPVPHKTEAEALVEAQQALMSSPDKPTVVTSDQALPPEEDEAGNIIETDPQPEANTEPLPTGFNDLRALAKDRGVTVVGTGSNGAVTKADLIKALGG